MDEREALISLNMMEQVGPVTADTLASELGSYCAIFNAKEGEMEKVCGIGRRTVAAICRQRSDVAFEEELDKAESLDIRVITRIDSEYPDFLRNIHDPPLALYVRGEFKSRDAESVAIVGTRRPTHYGREVAERFSFTLCKSGITVVSGLAEGIDTVAHEAALKARGRTLAVMGSGFMNIYPTRNRGLCEKILESGAVISEFPLAKRPDKTTFPMRNRIVSGLSRVVLVIEAGRRSGALITATQALEQGRTVYAVPGRVDSPASEGTNLLIKDGAGVATRPDDIIDEFDNLFGINAGCFPATARAVLDDREKLLLGLLESGPVGVDVLIRESSLDPGAVSSLLISLEMKKMIRMLPGRTVEKRQ